VAVEREQEKAAAMATVVGWCGVPTGSERTVAVNFAESFPFDWINFF
jgi:hypothetical protein